MRVKPPFGLHASLMQVNLHATLLSESIYPEKKCIARCAFLYGSRGGFEPYLYILHVFCKNINMFDKVITYFITKFITNFCLGSKT